MRDRRVALRYAQALLRTAKPAGTLSACAESYAAVLEIMAANRDLVIFLDSPQVRTQEKKDLLKKVLGPSLEPVLLDFYYLLLDRNRIDALRDIGEVFADLVEADQGVMRARVVTAIALPADLEEKLRAKLAQVTGKTIVLEKKVDPAVLGGACVTLGDRIIDGTVRTNLNRLRKTLGNAQVRL
jgi:F-type H+-transporting ATPase subunit delta